MSNDIVRFDQGFETGTEGWVEYGGTIDRVPSGENGIPSLDGSGHAVVQGSVYTRFGNYSSEFGGGYTTSIAVYLDVDWAAGQGFDYSVASNTQAGGHRRDFIFHVTKDTSTGDLLVGASNNTNFAPREDLESIGGQAITTSGWYIFEHTFRDNGDGTLAVDMSVYPSGSDTPVFSETLNQSSDSLETIVGGNRYGWFTAANVDGGIAVDDTSLRLAQGLGTSGADTIVGSDADEVFYASASNDTIDGAGGNDTFSFAPNATTGAYADLQSGVAFSGQTGFDTISNIENLAGTEGNDSFFGNAGDNIFFASAGTDTVDGRGNGSKGDTFDASAATSDVSINLSTGSATGFGGATSLSGIENATGGSGNDTLTGNSGSNILTGNDGDDSFAGNGGSDTISGGAGLDTVTYGALDADDFDLSGGGWAVTHGSGTDTLSEVEVVETGGGRFLLVGNGGYATIQEAIDAAGNGDTIVIAEGEYVTDLTITDRAISLVGVGNVVIKGQINVSDDMSSGDVFSMTNIDIDATGKQYGLNVRSSSADDSGAIVLDGVTIEGARSMGFFYAHPANGSNPVNLDTIGAISILNSTFENNGYIHSGARGHGHVNLFGFNGDLTLDNVDLVGPATNGVDSVFGTTPNGTTVNPHKAFTVTGVRTGTPGVGGYEDGGNLTINDVSVTGNYSSDAVSFYHIETFASISITDFEVNARAPWGLVNFDSVGGEIDMSGFSGTQLDGTSPIVTTLQGLGSNDVLTGSDGVDVLLGRGGDDTLVGGQGNDLMLGGSGIDTVVLEHTAFSLDLLDNATMVADADGKTAGAQPGWQLASGTADGTDTVEGVEIVVDMNGMRTLLVGGGGFASIADALLVAGSGDLILVASGHVEPGPITITTANSGVSLLSLDGSAVINGDGVNQGAAVRIEAGVENFSLGADGHGFQINAGSGDLAAVYVVGDNSGVTISGNDISGANGHALLTGGQVSNTSITNNELQADGPAAVVYINGATSLGAGNASVDVTIFNNQITGGADAGLLLGIEADSSDVIMNTFSGEASYAQLEVFGASANVGGNTFQADGDKAIVDAIDAIVDATLVGAQASFEPGAVRVQNLSGEGNVIYTSIQAAIDAAAPGATIYIGAGVFKENLTINKQVHLVGADGAVLEGALVDLVDGYGGLDEYFEANHPAYSASTGIDLQNDADGSSITGLTIRGFSEALSLGSVSGVTIEDNDFVNNVTGIRKGTGAQVSDLDILGNSFSHGIHGMTVYGNDTGTFDGVTMNDNTFSAMSEKGIYLEQVSNSSFDNNSFDDVGNYGRISPPFGGTDGEFGQAIDINLKSQTYENVVFTDTEITNSGYSNKNGAADYGDFGAAIGVKIRDDAPSYSSDPAGFNGSITFDGLVIDGTSTGVRVGEPGKDNDGPNVTLTNVTITDAEVGEVDNATDPVNGGTTVVEFSAIQTDLDASASQADVDVVGNDLNNIVVTGSGDDSFDGGLGADSFDGGDGIDTIALAGSYADYTVSVNGDGDLVLSKDGVDVTVANAEVLVFETGGNVHLVGYAGSDYASIQAAIDNSADGDTILIGAGDYAESAAFQASATPDGLPGTNASTNKVGLLVNKSVTLQGVDANGAAIADPDDVVATIKPQVQSNWGTQVFVTADNVSILGLGVEGLGTVAINKIIEVVGNGFTIQHSQVVAPDGVDVGSSIYVNDRVVTPPYESWVSAIDTLTIDGNLLEGDVVITNGTGLNTVDPQLNVTNNEFVLNAGADTFYNWGIIITGKDDGIAWRLADVALPNVSGNTFSQGYTEDRILYARGDTLANLPDRDYVEDFLANQAETGTYAFVTQPDEALRYQTTGTGTNGFAIHRSAGNASADAEDGDTLIVMSGADSTTQELLADDLTVIAREGSSDLNLVLGDGVVSVTVANSDTGAMGGENVDIAGNGEDNVIVGNDGDNVITGGAGADDMSGGGGNDTFVLNGAAEFETGEVIDGGAGDDEIVVNAENGDALVLTADVTGIETMTLTGGNNADLDASAVDNALTITGNDGDNVITGTAYVDDIDGGAGIDTVVYAGAEAITNAGGEWIVAGETLANIEVVEAGGARTLLVGDGGFATIQEAIDAANEGDTVLISEGTYEENLTISTDGLTIQAYPGHDVVVMGALSDALGMAPGTSTADFFKGVSSYTSDGKTGVTVSADNVTLTGITVQNFHYGVNLGDGVDGLTLNQVDITDAIVGLNKSTQADVSGITINGGSFTDSYHGIVFAKDANPADGHASGLYIDGTLFEYLTEKGIYAETLTDSIITGITMRDVGEFGRSDAMGTTGEWGIGIDINLKYGTYAGTILITDFTFENVGVSNGAGSSHFGGAAIAIKGRDDAPSYTGSVDVSGLNVIVQYGTIDGTTTGVRQGEPGKPDSASNVTGPSVTVTHVVITGATVSEIDNVSKSVMTVDACAPDGVADIYRAGTDDTATGPIVFIGNSDDNTFTGGRGDDSFSGDAGTDLLSGGDGDDSFIYTSMADLLDDTLDGGNGFDTLSFETTSDTDIVLGADTFGMEQVTIGGAAVNLDASAVTSGLSLVGNDAANVIIGTQGDDDIDAQGGNDTVIYASGNGNDTADGGADTDTLAVSATGAAGSAIVNVSELTGDLVVGLGGTASGSVTGSNFETLSITLGSADENEINLVGDLSLAGISSITVTGGNTRTALRADLMTSTTSLNVVFGSGDDTIYGGAGNDNLTGGLGFDTLNYAGVTQGVIVNLAANSAKGLGIGNDFVTGFEAVRGTALYDVIRGDALANTFYATAGADYIDGRGGVDMFDARLLVEDMEIDLGVGFAFNSEIGLTNLVSIEQVVGGRGNDIIYGTSGDNYIDGYVGDDYMEGGLGNDTYIVNTSADQVVENANEGHDTVHSLTNYVLGDNVEDLVLTGTSNRTGTGNGLDNLLVGNSGNNVLNGKGGADTMIGGAGNDTYYVNTYADTVVEQAGEGTDLIYSEVNYRLSDNVENITLIGTKDRWIEGNDLNNVMRGNTGNNAINGKGGVDQLWGQGGLDTFVFTDASHSGIGSGNRDVIRDFDADDLIDLSAIGSFDLLAKDAALSGTGNAELAFVWSGGNTIISADVDGDGDADFQIQVNGQFNLTTDDFLL